MQAHNIENIHVLSSTYMEFMKILRGTYKANAVNDQDMVCDFKSSTRCSICSRPVEVVEYTATRFPEEDIHNLRARRSRSQGLELAIQGDDVSVLQEALAVRFSLRIFAHSWHLRVFGP